MLTSVVKRLLRSMLRARGWELLRRPPALATRPEAVLLPTLGMLLAEMAVRRENPVVVQVGAFDGTSGDPLTSFLQLRRARALLLEPQPNPYSALCTAYVSHDFVTPVNAALGPKDGVDTMYIVEGDRPGDPEWLHQIASFQRDQVLRHARWISDLAERIRPIEVETITTKTLMCRYNVDQVDALVVDAEGFDWEIVKLFLESRVIPDVLFFEHKHLDDSTITQAIERLTDLRFKMDVIGTDLIASRFH